MSNQFEDLLGKMNEADEVKQPWEMTREEYLGDIYGEEQVPTEPYYDKAKPIGKSGIEHHKAVQKALSEGLPVPAEVLAGYPDLASAETNEATIFTEDRIESLEAKIAELDKMAKGTRKGQEQSSIYAKIDALEAELTKARIEAED